MDYVQQEQLQIFFVNPETVPSELFPCSIYWFKALLSKSLKAFSYPGKRKILNCFNLLNAASSTSSPSSETPCFSCKYYLNPHSFNWNCIGHPKHLTILNAWSWIWGKNLCKIWHILWNHLFLFPRAIPIPELCAATDTIFYFIFIFLTAAYDYVPKVTQIFAAWILALCTVTNLLLSNRCKGHCSKVTRSCFYRNYRLIDAIF